jgi:hypothetical protein
LDKTPAINTKQLSHLCFNNQEFFNTIGRLLPVRFAVLATIEWPLLTKAAVHRRRLEKSLLRDCFNPASGRWAKMTA